MLRKLFPFLFKSKKADQGPASATNGQAKKKRKPAAEDTQTAPAFGIIARNRNHRGLRKGSKIYVRQIFEDGTRLRVRGTAPNGKKVTLTVNRRALKDYASEEVPGHLQRHYNQHSIFLDEHEAKVKAEAFNKRH